MKPSERTEKTLIFTRERTNLRPLALPWTGDHQWWPPKVLLQPNMTRRLSHVWGTWCIAAIRCETQNMCQWSLQATTCPQDIFHVTQKDIIILHQHWGLFPCNLQLMFYDVLRVYAFLSFSSLRAAFCTKQASVANALCTGKRPWQN